MRKLPAELILLEPQDAALELLIEPIHSGLLEIIEVTRGVLILLVQREVAMEVHAELIHSEH